MSNSMLNAIVSVMVDAPIGNNAFITSQANTST